MSPGSLHLYRFAADAWAGGLRAWCAEAAGQAGAGVESWLVLENAGQQRWLARHGQGAAGVRVLDARSLRAALCERLGLEPPLDWPALGAFTIRALAHAAAGEEARAAAQDPANLLVAAQLLAGAGYGLKELGLPAAFTRALEKRRGLTDAALDLQLRRACPELPIRLACVGWDATRWPDLPLLETVAARARTRDLFVPAPRLPADFHQRLWIETLERDMELTRRVCPESDFPAGNEALVSRLENSGFAGLATPARPGLLVGRTWGDQVHLVCEEIRKWLGEKRGGTLPLGIIAPERSPTAAALADALAASGVPCEQPGRVREPEADSLILAQAARYYAGNQDVEELLELCRLLHAHYPARHAALEPGGIHRALDQAFRTAQSRNARILIRAQPRRADVAWAALRELVETLGRWDGELAWPALRASWEALLRGLGLATDPLEPVWTREGPLPGAYAVPGLLFMEWVGECLREQRLQLASPEHAAAHRVVLTTFAEAAQQPWGRLIFLDSNEHVWPLPVAENPFLPDARLAELNQARRQHPYIPTARDHWALEQARFLDLLENCSGGVAFAGTLLDQTGSGEKAQPNEWVLRAWMATKESAGDAREPAVDPAAGMEAATEVGGPWAAAAQAAPALPAPELPPDDLAHFQAVHAARQDPAVPPDEYSFAYGGSELRPQAWSATALDQALTTPATFALATLFDAESTQGEPFTRAEGMAIGNRAHQWLGPILGCTPDFQKVPRADYEARLARELATARRELEEWYAAEGAALPLWWKSCLQKAAYTTRRCFRDLAPVLEDRLCAMEYRLMATLPTQPAPLMLKGRIDILLSDSPELRGAHLQIFDFKTGKQDAVSLATLDRGEGHQFAAYYLMARAAGAASATVGLIKPDEIRPRLFSDEDELPLLARFSRLAELQRTLCFARTGPLFSEYRGCETLPMATLPIDPKILEAKAALQTSP